MASGLALLRSGISIGMSTAMGRGWVSNSSGKPITPSSTSTPAPISRCLARLRIASMLSGGWRVAAGSSAPLRNLKKAMKSFAWVGSMSRDVWPEGGAPRPPERPPPCRTIRRRRFYQRGPPRRPRRAALPWARHGCSRPRRGRVSCACQLRQQRGRGARARGVGRSVKYQRSTSGPILLEHRPPGPCRPSRRTRACVVGKKPIASRLAASAATECGLCATSSTSAGWPGTIWKRPGSSTSARPLRTACAVTGRRCAQRLQRGQHARGVDQLVGAAQRRIGQARVAPAAPGPGPLLLVAGEIEVAAQAPQVGADLARRGRSRCAAAPGRSRWPACRCAGCRPSRGRCFRGPAPGSPCGPGRCW